MLKSSRGCTGSCWLPFVRERMLARALPGRQSVCIAVRSGGAAIPDAHQETWRAYYGDLHVGTFMAPVGNAPQWQWRCGFYPGSERGECKNGTAATFDEARADFEAAWRVFLSKPTEADFQEWRD